MSARNILNTEEVTRFTEALARRARHDDVRTWTRRTARRWILKTHDRYDRVVRDAATGATCIDGAVRVPLPDTWPDAFRAGGARPHPAWLGRALDDGQDVVRLRLDRELYGDVLRVIRYLDAMQVEFPTRNVGRVSFVQAESAARAWRAARRTGASRRAGEDVVFRADTGEEVVELTTRFALAEEGRRMSHCVGDYDEDVAGGRAFIYSLRAPGGKSRATLEISPEGGLVQAFGPCNFRVPENVRPALSAFLEAGGFSLPDLFPGLPELAAAYKANSGDLDATFLSPAAVALFRRYRFIENEEAPEYAALLDAFDEHAWFLEPDTACALFRLLHPGEQAIRVRKAANWWVYDHGLPELRVAAPLLLLRLRSYGIFSDAQDAEITAIERRIEAALLALTMAPADRLFHLGRAEVQAPRQVFPQQRTAADLIGKSRIDIRGLRSLRHLGLRQRMNRWKKEAGHRRLPPSEGHQAVRRLLDGEAGAYVI